MIKKILIANRGEIAVRIIRACKEIGIKSAAIYSEADKTSLHARMADESYLIGGSKSSESYLQENKIINLAKKIKADAIHPGYGFFSENSNFIKKIEKTGIIFIGPSYKSVSMMGIKTSARTLMKKNGVPIVPGTTEAIKSLQMGKKKANEIGYPILLKAASGGGGKGMRVVNFENEFKDALEATKRESKKYFDSDEIYLEKYIENPKHIEVQILGDKFGNYVHLFERECSIQRRHQKIIEEAPSSFVDEVTREKITTAAINAAKACKYYNAGTIEFLMDKNKSFYFLEMNTRLQVEHPVTELISGIDLVKEQIRIADGKKLSFNQESISLSGHALECRIYAEDAENNFLPSTGKVTEFNIPSGPGVRVDSGIANGSEVTVFYDPLIAKLICWANDRKSVIDRMNRALAEFEINGVINNIDYLNKIVRNKNFMKGDYDIKFIEKEKLEELHCKENKSLENAAYIFAALIQKNKQGKIINNSKLTAKNNTWFEQNYE